MTELTALLDQFESPPMMSILDIVINLVLAAALGSLLGWHYSRRGRTLTNREGLARVLPFIALTTVLVITIVQSSLALALGLVGALSIVRFRTPIKEPEELAHLFLAIGLGLGLGAQHRVLTIVAFAVILGFLMLTSRRGAAGDPQHLYLNVEVQHHGEAGVYDKLLHVLSQNVRIADLRRLDTVNGTIQATFFIDTPSQQAVLDAVESLKRAMPDASISLIDSRQTLGV